MNYFGRIRELTKNVPAELVDFSQPRDLARVPTQASSNFITNKEQGDWAENLIIRAINELSKNHVAIKYGKSDDLVAGEEGFDTFFQEFQNELDTIGKRPDLLIFNKKDYISEYGTDISHIPHSKVNKYVTKAVAGIEVRSSAFLINRYDEAMERRTEKLVKIALETKEEILTGYKDILSQPSRENYIDVLNGITARTLNKTDFKVPGWRSSERSQGNGTRALIVLCYFQRWDGIS